MKDASTAAGAPLTRRALDLAVRSGGRLAVAEVARELALTLRDAEAVVAALCERYVARAERPDPRRGATFRLAMPLRRRPWPVWRRLRAAARHGLRGAVYAAAALIVTLYGLLAALLLLGLDGEARPAIVARMRRALREPAWAWQAVAGVAGRLVDLAVGPPDPEDVWSHLEEVHTFLSHNEGVLTCADVMAVSGCSREAADAALTKMLWGDRGSLRVTEDGVLLYLFGPERAHPAVAAPPVRWSWEREAAERRRHRPGRHQADILLLCGLGLLGSVILEIAAARTGTPTGLARILLADLPLVASATICAMPILRGVGALLRRDRDERRRLRVRALRVLRQLDRPFRPAIDLADCAPAERARLERHLRDVSGELEGQLGAGRDGGAQVAAPRLHAEWSASVRARDRLRSGASLPGSGVLR